MRHTTGMVLFGLIMTMLVSLVHYYFWRRLVRDTQIKAPWRQIAGGTLAALVIVQPVSMILGRMWGRDLLGDIIYYPFLWMGTMVLLFFSLVAADVLKVTRHLASRLRGNGRMSRSRRVFLNRVVAGAALSSSGGLTGAAIYQGKMMPKVKRTTVRLPLPKTFDGFKIVQLTDLHIGHTLDGEWLRNVVNQANRLAPDLIAITGDVVDGEVRTLGKELSPLAELDARFGVCMVTGNHEYYAGVDEWIHRFESLGLEVLRNEHRLAQRNGASIAIAGVDDFNAKRIEPTHGPDLPKALDGILPGTTTVLLAHQPRAVFEAAEHKVDLVLSGHTHGGQIWPITHFVRLQQPYNRGLHNHSDVTQIYISQGTGYWGPPMRLGTFNEISEIILASSSG